MRTNAVPTDYRETMEGVYHVDSHIPVEENGVEMGVIWSGVWDSSGGNCEYMVAVSIASGEEEGSDGTPPRRAFFSTCADNARQLAAQLMSAAAEMELIEQAAEELRLLEQGAPAEVA